MNYISIVKYKATTVNNKINFKITKNHDSAVNPLLHNQFSNIVHKGINMRELNTCFILTGLNKDAIKPVAAKIR